jgi:hypothetical protein
MISGGFMRRVIVTAGVRLFAVRATVAPPFVAFIAGWSLLAWRAPGGWAAVFDPATFTRRDAFQYLKIARHGYHATTNCAAMGPGVHLCGNVTWFPGYPGLIRVVAVSGLRYAAAGLVIAWVCWYLTLLMIWVLSAHGKATSRTPTRWAALMLAAFFPGQVYFGALFPISLVTFAMLLCVYLATRPQTVAGAFAAGLVAGAAYPLAVAMTPGLGVGAVLAASRRTRVVMVSGAAGVLAGVIAVLTYAQLAVGKWDAYFITEREEYGVRLHNPLTTLLHRDDELANPTTSALHTITAQRVLIAALVAAALVAQLPLVVRAARGFLSRKPGHPRIDVTKLADLALLGTGCVAWAIPYVGGGVLSIYRSEAIVIVLVPLLRRLPAWLVAAAVAAAVVIAYEMAPLFFANTLV